MAVFLFENCREAQAIQTRRSATGFRVANDGQDERDIFMITVRVKENLNHLSVYHLFNRIITCGARSCTHPYWEDAFEMRSAVVLLRSAKKPPIHVPPHPRNQVCSKTPCMASLSLPGSAQSRWEKRMSEVPRREVGFRFRNAVRLSFVHERKCQSDFATCQPTEILIAPCIMPCFAR